MLILLLLLMLMLLMMGRRDILAVTLLLFEREKKILDLFEIFLLIGSRRNVQRAKGI